MHKIRMIYNPEANRGTSYQMVGDLHQLSGEWGGADWIGTDYPGHATELSEAACQAGYETIVALGGDGTVHEVVNGIMKVDPSRRPKLGVVPIGSGNDFSKGAGIPLDPIAAIRKIFQDGRERPIDIGSIQDDHGRLEYWCNALGIGFDAAITIQSRTIPWLHGFLMYLAGTLRTIILKFEKPCLEIDLDGEKRSGRFIMLTIGNGVCEGGGFRTTPDAIMDDGWLDYLLVDPVSRLRMIRLIPEVMRGTQGRFPEAHMGRLKHLQLTSDIALPIQNDGEMFAPYAADVRRVEIAILPKAVKVIV
jgi:diacylglycerol kinase (ATP)